jgi:carbamoyl-phosphate synthase large subunit
LDQESPNTEEYIRDRKLDLVINTPNNCQEEELTNDYIIRLQAVNFGIPIITRIHLARRFVEALSHYEMDDFRGGI